MKQPYILYEGEKREVSSINWHDGKIHHACFTDKDGAFHTAFQSDRNFEEGCRTGSLHLDLKTRITAE